MTAFNSIAKNILDASLQSFVSHAKVVVENDVCDTADEVKVITLACGVDLRLVSREQVLDVLIDDISLVGNEWVVGQKAVALYELYVVVNGVTASFRSTEEIHEEFILSRLNYGSVNFSAFPQKLRDAIMVMVVEALHGVESIEMVAA